MAINSKEQLKLQVIEKKDSEPTIKDVINAQIEGFKMCLPSDMSAERLCRIAINNYRSNEKLSKCSMQSFIAALFQSAQLGLEPGIGGQAYLIPYGDKVNFQIGYQGLVKLFYRCDKSSTLDMQKVYANDKFEMQLGTEGYIKHIPTLIGDRGEVVAFYAIATMTDGHKVFKVMSKKECIEHGKAHSKSFYDKKSPWQTEPDAMCMKTVLIQLLKVMPKSIELARALDMDNTTKSKVAEDMHSVKDETDWSKTREENKKEIIEAEIVEEPKNIKVEVPDEFPGEPSAVIKQKVMKQAVIKQSSKFGV